ncbi:hypothetical protein F5Y17DRAFT_54099 [Xylariaceae sp. FL0594]|nr:hypothetical protein F5Y17DRAFT_54099 [Xylariaceae sp. FL0594]
MGAGNAEAMADFSKDPSRSHSKGEKASKKRHRDPASTSVPERKNKRSKSTAAALEDQPPADIQTHERSTETQDAPEEDVDQTASTTKSKKKKSKKEREPEIVSDHEDTKVKKEKKEKKDEKEKKERKEKHRGPDNVVVLSSAPGKPPASAQQPGTSSHQYPFYTQTVSQYLPLHPSGVKDPIQGYTNQHLNPLLNRYVPSFRGVLLAYRNVRVGEAPGKASLTENSGGDDAILLESINEHAVCFGWLTAEIDIFKPLRGAWLEGLVNLQSAGHIGVVCWGKFNASIESERLPRDWKWVSQLHNNNVESEEEEEMDEEVAEPKMGHREVHTTGYWVDGEGNRVTSDVPIRFRIKQYEIPVSGDHGYLILEGTMLTVEEEEARVHKEVATIKNKIRHGVVLRRDRRPLLESSITKFGEDEDKDKEREGRRGEA